MWKTSNCRKLHGGRDATILSRGVWHTSSTASVRRLWLHLQHQHILRTCCSWSSGAATKFRTILRQGGPDNKRSKLLWRVGLAILCGWAMNTCLVLEYNLLLPILTLIGGSTKQHYQELNKLYAKLRHEDFEILGFPSNQFGAQEPDSNKDIAGFCESSGVKFRIMDKINVNGHTAHNVYKFLKQKLGIPRIEWNFRT